MTETSAAVIPITAPKLDLADVRGQFETGVLDVKTSLEPLMSGKKLLGLEAISELLKQVDGLKARYGMLQGNMLNVDEGLRQHHAWLNGEVMPPEYVSGYNELSLNTGSLDINQEKMHRYLEYVIRVARKHSLPPELLKHVYFRRDAIVQRWRELGKAQANGRFENGVEWQPQIHVRELQSIQSLYDLVKDA